MTDDESDGLHDPKDWSIVHEERMRLLPNAPAQYKCRLCGQTADNQLVTQAGNPFVSVLCEECNPQPSRRAKRNVPKRKQQPTQIVPTNPLYLIHFANVDKGGDMTSQ